MTEAQSKKLEKVIRSTDTAILSTIDANGYPNTRALDEPRKIVGLNEFYFSTNTASKKIQHIKKNNKACLYFFVKGFVSMGAMLLGTAEIINDEKLKQELWQDGDELHYPNGHTDPDYSIVKFTAKKCRHYAMLTNEEFEL